MGAAASSSGVLFLLGMIALSLSIISLEQEGNPAMTGDIADVWVLSMQMVVAVGAAVVVLVVEVVDGTKWCSWK